MLICDNCARPAEREDGLGWIHSGRLLADREGRPLFYPLASARHFCSDECQVAYFRQQPSATQRLPSLTGSLGNVALVRR